MTESWLGAPKTANRDGRGWGGGGVCVFTSVSVCARACVRACMRACVMCLQYTIMIFYPG